MGMPRHLFLVRHGESEGNVANRKSRKGDDSHFTNEFLKVHSSNWALTERGVEQAKRAGQWIRENFLNTGIGSREFDGLFVSEFARTRQTASHMALNAGRWKINRLIVERDWGLMDSMPHGKRVKKYAEVIAKRLQAMIFWRPIDGERLIDLEVRIRSFFDTLHRTHDGKDVIVVAHGEVIEMMQCILERMTQAEFKEYSSDKGREVGNCSIVQYTRMDLVTMQMQPHFTAVRLIAAGDTTKASHDWRPIKFKTYSDADLLY